MMETLKTIKKFTGVDFETCDYFTKILSEKDKENIFDILLKEPMWLSTDYNKLENFAKKYNLITIKPSGYKRVRIYINKQ